MKNIKTILLPIILVFALTTGSWAEEPTKPSTEASTETQKSFRFECSYKGKFRTATAFYYSKNLLMTAAHTFAGTEPPYYIRKNDKKVACEIVKIDYDRDICVIKTEEANAAWYEFLPLGKIQTVAFPDGDGPKLSEGSTVSLKFAIYFYNGSSGGPLLSGGKVIGMGVKRDEWDVNSCYAIPSDELVAFIKLAEHPEKK